MTSAHETLPAHRPRKATYTYSLTVHGDTFHLTAPASVPSYYVVAEPLPSPPISLPHKEIVEDLPPNIPSTSRLFVPCPPLPRGPRTNLYLFRPTTADTAKEQKRSAARAVALEEAKKEREDDERRRNLDLGIPVPRKSTRKVKSRLVSTTGASVVVEEKPAIDIERQGRKSRASVKSTPMGLCPPASRQVSASAVAADESPASSSLISPETTPSLQRSRRKPQSKLNPRPTERLTTRSLAKAKATSVVGESDPGNGSVPPSEVGDYEDVDMDVDTRDGVASAESCSARPRDSLGRLEGASTVVPYISDDFLPFKPSPPSQTTNRVTRRRSSNPEISNGVVIASTPAPPKLQEKRRDGEVPSSLHPPLYSRASSSTIGRHPSPLSQTHMADADSAEDTNSGVSSSGEVQSSDTLYDVAGNVLHGIKKELMADDVMAGAENAIQVTDLPLLSQSMPLSLLTDLPGRTSVSPAFTNATSFSSDSAPTSNGKGNKRNVDDIDGDSKAPALIERRRSGRVIKKRKFS